MWEPIERPLIVALMLSAAFAAAPLDARIRGGAPLASPANTCPNGTTNAELDGCEEASLSAFYQNTSMNDYFKDDDGVTAVLAVTPGQASGVPFNVAGRDFPVGPIAPFVYKDPADYYFATSTANVNGTTFTATTVTQGTVKNGMILWSSPSTSGLLTNHPVLSNCTGGTPAGGSGTVCTLSISQTNKTGPYKGSHAPGCSWANGGAAVSVWTCNFQYPNQALTATFDHFDFGAVGGHTSTLLSVSASDNGIPTLVMTSNNIPIDAQTNGQSGIRSVPGVKVNLVFEDNNCDGGNSSVATGAAPAAFNFAVQSACMQWNSEGTSISPITVSFKRNWIHDYAGNPIQISTGYSTVVSQANVFYRPGMNNGNDIPGGQTGLHGASINWNTTAVGATGTVKRYNDVVIYPYGYRAGVTTAPFALLGGLGSAVTIDYDQQLTTSIVNAAQPGQAISSQWFRALRVGALSNIKMQNNYVSTVGIANGGCFKAGGDVQVGAITASLTASPGNRWSSWNVSGIFTAGKEKPFPRQVITNSAGSGARYWYATFTDNGNGTSQMNISLTVVGPTNNMPAGWSVVGLGMTDPVTNPTLIVSGSGTSYVVSDGTGSGHNLTTRAFQYGIPIQPFGTNGTTATGGSTPTNYNGTYSVGVEDTLGSTTTWEAFAIIPTNYATIETDVSSNFDVLSGSSLLVGGIDLSSGTCPGTNPG